MNILLTLNDYYCKYATVMLTSLLINCKKAISVFCLFDKLSESNMRLLNGVMEKYEQQEVHFIRVNRGEYDKFPVTDRLTVECYFILLAHMFLPEELDRILYLDSDIIVEEDLSELYDMDFDDKHIVACGQSYKYNEGVNYRKNARPEKGQLFNTGVLLINLQMFRESVTIDTYIDAAKKYDYDFSLADQGILNITFENSVKYIPTMKYNFRLGIAEMYSKEQDLDMDFVPSVVHFPTRDNYRIGYIGKPWELYLDEDEIIFLEKTGRYTGKYELRHSDKKWKWMIDRWWHYAKKTDIFQELWDRMLSTKRTLFEQWYPTVEYKNAVLEYRKTMMSDFKKITENHLEQIGELKQYKYLEFKEYIDSLDSKTAVETLENLFNYNLANYRKKKIVDIAFLVSSPSEWEMDTVYRKLEMNSRYRLTLIICGYPHGTPETIRNTYLKTCEYFRKREKKYNILFAGYDNERSANKSTEYFDVIFYAMPHPMLPTYVGFEEMRLTSLGIFTQYGIELVSREDARYNYEYYDRIQFQLAWKYFCTGELVKQNIESNQRLKAFNVEVSGFAKADMLTKKSKSEGNKFWHGDEHNIRIIFAPHFNLETGQNGTFHMNYRWFLEYAKSHLETSWVMKPHPRLCVGAIEKGIFADLAEYEDYLNEWRRLPNAYVMEHGDYWPVFASSDCMILDSLSFLAQYQYVNKPLLFLIPDVPRGFNEMGNQLLEVLYKAKGNDFSGIEDFIENVRTGNDGMYTMRSDFFKKNLDNKIGISATEYICQRLDSVLGK